MAEARTTRPEGYADLTEKEKETLRLMVRGHDAKSMAGELALSVHTINERLRAARRKLAVTSSREAARLVWEHERGTPDFSVYDELGDASGTPASEDGQEAAARLNRRIVAGVLAMMIVFAAGLILASHFDEPVRQGAPVDVPASDATVVAAARDWLALTDAQDWQASFDAAGKAFRDVNTVSGWASAAQQVQAPLGALVSRELRAVRYLNAPPYGYQEVHFTARYANRTDEVIETVTLQQEDGAWKVVGILVE
ncbi:DUF4019 domain-containing protein [Erythrobacter sp. AP23]|uniref:helix-turn-helix domain-containing protein n=1 Tax=Erythrobacter sp. AP23 TaxID=499656 RepID=UPI00076BF075|nr:DUF4019 domain-containing protein [Erythrobacter sp. AP23]KWV94953.1 hypothetical protein ASS64_07120 [Erythrobacter sp. AP23]